MDRFAEHKVIYLEIQPCRFLLSHGSCPLVSSWLLPSEDCGFYICICSFVTKVFDTFLNHFLLNFNSLRHSSENRLGNPHNMAF